MLSLRCLLILLCFAPSLPVLESEELPLLSESAIANDVVTSAGVGNLLGGHRHDGGPVKLRGKPRVWLAGQESGSMERSLPP